MHGVDRKARPEYLEGTLGRPGTSMNRYPTGSATTMESAFARRLRETLAVALFQPLLSLPLQPPSRQPSPLSDAEISFAGWQTGEVCNPVRRTNKVTTADRGIARARVCRGCVLKPASERIGAGLLSARSWEFADRLQSVFNQDHPDMRQAGGSTNLKPSIRQHAQNQHKGYGHRKRVMPDK